MTWSTVWMVLERGGWVVIGAWLYHITMFEEKVSEAHEDGMAEGMML